MRRILVLLPLLLLPIASAHAQTAPDARVAQVDTSRYPDVTLYVSVTDAAGGPVAGMSQRAFSISEDGQPVTISEFAGGGAAPISAVLVIDRSQSMAEEDKLAGARDAAQAFVRQMRPGDQTAVIAFDTRPTLVQPFTGDVGQLDKAIRRITPGESTALYDSLIDGVDLLKGVQGRRALLLLTDGRDCVRTPCINDPASRATLDEAIAHARQAGVAAQVIGLGDRDTADLSAGIDEPVLRRIAGESGGEYFYAPAADQLAELYQRLSADMQQEYRLTYRSPRPFYDGTRRDIRVSVSGAAPVAGGYVERHLIDVRSNPLVGFALLLPILAALLLPGRLRRTRSGATPQSAPVGAPAAAGADALAGGGSCRACDRPLLRAEARFCSACGASQADPPARRIFCDQCGRPIADGAHFCSICGTSSPIRMVATGER